MRRLLNTLPLPQKKYWWLALILMLKVPFFIWYGNSAATGGFYDAGKVINNIAIYEGDTRGYIDPVENFINGKGYSSKKNGTNTYEPYSKRMPGFILTYGPLYKLFGPHTGQTIWAILQLLLNTLAVYLAGLSLLTIVKKDWAFYLFVFLYSISAFANVRESYLLAESFSMSFFLIGLYLFFNMWKINFEAKWHQWFLCGLFLCFSILYRPFLVVYFPLFFLVVWWSKGLQKRATFHLILFALPFVLFESLWITRNHQQYGEFYPLESHDMEYNETMDATLVTIRKFVITIGGDYQPWSAGGELNWFMNKNVKDNPFTSSDFCNAYSLDSLQSIKTSILSGNKQHKKLARKRLSDYTISYKNQRPFYAYFINKLELLKKVIVHKRLDNIPFPSLEKMTLAQKAYKGLNFIGLNVINVLAFLFALILLFKSDSIQEKFVSLIFLGCFIIIGPILGFIEYRFLFPSYFAGLFIIIFILDKTLKRFKISL